MDFSSSAFSLPHSSVSLAHSAEAPPLSAILTFTLPRPFPGGVEIVAFIAFWFALVSELTGSGPIPKSQI